MGTDQRSGFLAPYRVLDVTDHRGLLAGHILAQLGADVVQMEPPGGSDGRHQPPFHPSWPDGENSFYWAAYASGKRSIVCDPGVDPEIWEQLVLSADILLDSAAPGEGRPDWLDPAALALLNPRLIHVSITPFGLTGPKKDWLDSEIVRRQNIWHNLRRRLAECGPRLGLMFRRRVCGVASADIGVSVA